MRLNLGIIVPLLVLMISVLSSPAFGIVVNTTTSPSSVTTAPTNTSTTSTTTSTSTTTTTPPSSSDSHASEQCDSNWGCEYSASVLIFSFMVMLCGSVLVVYGVTISKLKYLPESVAVVIYGIIVGIILRYIQSPVAKHLSSFDTEAFFLFILPCIIFETGFSLPKTPFFSNLGSILMFAVPGTVISFLAIGVMLYAVGALGWSIPLSLWESLVFGSFMSATDPVATLAIFQALNVDSTLYMIVLGESILNDAVALILYRATYNFSAGHIFITIAEFFLVFLGSPVLGAVIAMLLSGLLRAFNIARFPPLETILMIIFAYTSYVLAEAMDLSGIMSVFWCGIAFNHYGAYSLSAYTTLTSRQLFRTAAFICETCVFIYIGILLPNLRGGFDIRFVLWTVIICLVARVIHVFPLSLLLNLKRKKKLSWQLQVALWFAGLRGAIAFSLALATDTPHFKEIQTTTLAFVHFTLFVMGCGTLPLLNVLKIKTADSDQSLDNIIKPRQKSEQKKKSKAASFVANFDEKYLKHYFRRPVQPLAKEALELFEKLAINTLHESARGHATRHDDDEEGGYSKVSTTDHDNDEIRDTSIDSDNTTTSSSTSHNTPPTSPASSRAIRMTSFGHNESSEDIVADTASLLGDQRD